MATELCTYCSRIDFQSLACPWLSEIPLILTRDAQTIEKWFPQRHADHRQKQFDLGTLEDIRTRGSSCKLCRLIWKTIRRLGLFSEAEEEFTQCHASNQYFGVFLPPRQEHLNNATILRLSIYTSRTGKDQNWGDRHAQYCFQACAPGTTRIEPLSETVNRQREIPAMAFGGRKRPLVVDVARLQEWLHLCEEKHGPTCGPPMEDNQHVPYIRFVDANAMSVVTMHDVELKELGYMALSYVWGAGQTRVLKELTLEELALPHALSEQPASITIMQALELARRLQIRYVWVDSLCIMQDSDTDKKSQLQLMGDIYRLARMTLIAAAGSNADSGLPGLFPGTRHTEQEEVCVIQPTDVSPGLSLMTALNPKSGRDVHYLDETTWGTRGWTFQERFLSRRVMTFTDEQVFFSCNNATFCEESFFEHDIRLYPFLRTGMELSLEVERHHNEAEDANERFWVRYYQAIWRFTRRHFKYDGDVFDAFLGLEQTMTRLYGETFLWGMPRSRFNDALSWSTFLGQRRRMSMSTLAMTELDRKVPFPSWSWMGWVGEAHVSVTDERRELGDIAIVDTYTHVKNGSSVYMARVQQESVISDELVQLEDALVTHSQLTTQALLDIPCGHIIFFWAYNAFFDVSPAGPVSSNPDRPILLDNDGAEVGSTGPMQDSHWQSSGANRGRWEFIAIGRRQLLDFEAFYTVLQIERTDGLALRVNMGEICERDWLRARQKKILVALA